MPLTSSLKGKNVLVTGGSRGIGKAIVHAYVDAGARVTVVHRTANEHAAQLDRELKERAAEYVLICADVSDPQSVDAIFDEHSEFADAVDVLVNNAGVMVPAPFDRLSLDEWNRHVAVNLTGPMLMSQRVLSVMPDGGAIVNVGSKLARVGLATRTHYCATKAGLEGLSRSLAKELGPRGIRVNLVAPGVIETEAVSDPELRAAIRKKYGNLAALGRLGEVGDIASVAVFLGSGASGYMTGEIVTVDGGI